MSEANLLIVTSPEDVVKLEVFTFFYLNSLILEVICGTSDMSRRHGVVVNEEIVMIMRNHVVYVYVRKQIPPVFSLCVNVIVVQNVML